MIRNAKQITFILIMCTAPVACDSDARRSLDDFDDGISALGRIDTYDRMRELTTRRGGVIAEIMVPTGQVVEPGQILARLTCDEEVASSDAAAAGVATTHAGLQELLSGTRVNQLFVAEAQLDAARHRQRNAVEQYDRQKELGTKGLSSDQTISDLSRVADETESLAAAAQSHVEDLKAGPRENQIELARAKLDEAKATHAAAKAKVDGCAIRAPITGEVLKILKWPGEYVSPEFGDVVLIFGDSRNTIVRAEFNERDAQKLHLNQIVSVKTLDSSEIFEGEIIELPRVVGRSTIRSLDPTHRFDNDIVEVIVRLAQSPETLYFGQQVIIDVL